VFVPDRYLHCSSEFGNLDRLSPVADRPIAELTATALSPTPCRSVADGGTGVARSNIDRGANEIDERTLAH
jgi:hypothetical protein